MVTCTGNIIAGKRNKKGNIPRTYDGSWNTPSIQDGLWFRPISH